MKTFLILTILTTILTHSSMAQKLKPQDKAPSFEIKSVQGELINLQKYKGRTVLLAFFRFAGCPVCNFRMHELVKNYPALKAQNVEVIAIFESKNETLFQYIDDAKIPFPVIGNPDLTLYKLYGTSKSMLKMMRTMFRKKPKQEMKSGEKLYNGKKYKQDGSMTRIPADFLIDQNGNVKIAHYGRFIGDHIPIQDLMK